MAFEPFVRTILLGQVNLVLLAWWSSTAWWFRPGTGDADRARAGIKILPGAFVLFLILKRQWWAVARAAAVFAGTVAVGALFAPHDSWLFWRGGFVNLSRFGPESVIGGDNQSLSAAFMRLARDTSPPCCWCC